ncbi:hypothetical protein PMIN07_002878 [Paraphaeosphaeria minitans]
MSTAIRKDKTLESQKDPLALERKRAFPHGRDFLTRRTRSVPTGRDPHAHPPLPRPQQFYHTGTEHSYLLSSSNHSSDSAATTQCVAPPSAKQPSSPSSASPQNPQPPLSHPHSPRLPLPLSPT